MMNLYQRGYLAALTAMEEHLKTLDEDNNPLWHRELMLTYCKLLREKINAKES